MDISGVDFFGFANGQRMANHVCIRRWRSGLSVAVCSFASLGGREVSFLGPSLQTQQHGVFCYSPSHIRLFLLHSFSLISYHFSSILCFIARRGKILTIVSLIVCLSIPPSPSLQKQKDALNLSVAQEQEMEEWLDDVCYSPLHHSSSV
jgi:hypothetical protein